jgi:LysR family glycine cleavage system transcriptional activator
VFVAVAQHLSFTRAADALGVTASAASLQIRALEEYLGRTLLRRNGHHVFLTDQGADLLPRIQRALEDLELALDGARMVRGSSALRLTTLASFLQQWLLPRLPRFRATQPAIALYLHTSLEMVDFVRSDHEAAIRLGVGPRWPGVHAEKLFDEWLVPVCAPALLAKHGPVDVGDSLDRYPLLHSVGEPWTSWRDFAQTRSVHPPNPAGPYFDDSATVVRSAARGHGLALARWSLVADEVADGTLAIACRNPVPFPRSYWLVYPRRVRALATVEAFRTWLFDEATRFPTPPAVTHRRG